MLDQMKQHTDHCNRIDQGHEAMLGLRRREKMWEDAIRTRDYYIDRLRWSLYANVALAAALFLVMAA